MELLQHPLRLYYVNIFHQGEKKMYFNKQKFQVNIIFLTVLFLFSAVFTTISHAAYTDDINKFEQEKESIQNDKVQAGNQVATLRKEKAAWVELKGALDEQNRLTQEEILNTMQQIETYDLAILEKQEEADAAQLAAEEAFAVYKKHLRSMEENGQLQSYMQVLVGAEDFSEILTRIDTISEIMEYDRRIERAYIDARDTAMTVK